MSRTLSRIRLSMRLLLLSALLAFCGSSARAQSCVDNIDCDDTLFCNGEEQCIGLLCEPGTPPCVDAHACTIDTCNDDTDTCTFTPNNGACSDGEFCTGVETCDVNLGCRSGTSPCADAIACTIDACNEGNNTCTNTPNHAACDDNLFCTGVETCSAASGCVPGTQVNCSQLNDQCNVGVCDDGVDACVRQPANQGGQCSDGLFCTVGDICTAGTCGGPQRNCSDLLACSTDSCSEGQQQCLHNPVPNCPDCSGDGVPDLCVSTSAFGANWSDDIWGLGPGNYPDNGASVAGLFAELLSPASIFLDVDVLIAGLAVRPGATLNVTGQSLGDLTIKSGGNGGVINDGRILVAHNRAISVPDGSFVISGLGQYVGVSLGGVPPSASLSAQSISLVFGGCGTTARMEISDGMTVTATTGNLVLDGTGVLLCAPPGGNAASRGGKTPPILKVASPTAVSARGQTASTGGGVPGQLNIAGSFQMIDGAEVCVGCEGPVGGATPSIVVNGDFDNQSVLPSFFRWARGDLIFPATGVSHVFEVGGIDMGPASQGFNTQEPALFDTAPHTNFAVDTIVLRNGSQVTFQNTFTNTVGTGLGAEALYVRNLSLGSGSTVTIDGCTVYFCDLEDGGGQFEFLNGGALVAASCAIPAVSTWGLLAMSGLLLCAGTVAIARRRTTGLRHVSAAEQTD